MPFVPPGIVLKNNEDLALPLTASQAADLRSLAEPAPYGMGAETRLDESVRKCWQIDAAELRWISANWQKTLEGLVKEIAGERRFAVQGLAQRGRVEAGQCGRVAGRPGRHWHERPAGRWAPGSGLAGSCPTCGRCLLPP